MSCLGRQGWIPFARGRGKSLALLFEFALAKVEDSPTFTVGDTLAPGTDDERAVETGDRLSRTVTSALRVPSAIRTLLVDGPHVGKSSSGSCCTR